MDYRKVTRSINDINDALEKIKSIFQEIIIELNKSRLDTKYSNATKLDQYLEQDDFQINKDSITYVQFKSFLHKVASDEIIIEETDSYSDICRKAYSEDPAYFKRCITLIRKKLQAVCMESISIYPSLDLDDSESFIKSCIDLILSEEDAILK